MALFGKAIPIDRVIRKRTKNKAKKIKSNSFTNSNREKFDIAIAILKNKKIIAPKLFCILNVPITFSLNLLEIFSIFRVLLNFLNSRNNLRLNRKL